MTLFTRQTDIRGKVALGVVCACAVVAILLQVSGLRIVFQSAVPMPLWALLPQFVPIAFFLFILIRIVQRGDVFALSFALGLALGMFLMVAYYIVLIAGVTLLAPIRAPTNYWWMLPNLVILGMASLVGLIQNRRRSSSLTRIWGIGIGFVAGWIFSSAIYAVPNLGREPYFEEKALMDQRADLASVITATAQQCISEFKNRTEGRFPGSLEEFERSEQSCLDNVFKKGRKSNAVFQYASSPDGKHFSLRMIYPKVDAPYPLRLQSFYLDESGSVVAENVVPAFNDFHLPPEADEYAALLYGLGYYASQHSGSYPANLDSLFQELPPVARSNLERVDASTVTYKDYTIYYTSFIDGQPSFVLEVRPTQKDKAGLSSYYADQTGSVHATASARPATVADPVVAKCETSKPGACPGAILAPVSPH